MRKIIVTGIIAVSTFAAASAESATFTCYGRAFNMLQNGESLIGGWQQFDNGRSPAIIVNDNGSGPFVITDTAGKNRNANKYSDQGDSTVVSSVGVLNSARLAQRKASNLMDSFYFQNNYENLRQFVFFRSVDGEGKNGWISTQSYGTCFR